MYMKKIALLLCAMCAFAFTSEAAGSDDNTADPAPLRLAVAGVTHGHLGEVRSRVKRGDFIVVGVSEKNDEYRKNNSLTGLVPEDRFYSSLAEMLDATKPEVVVAYGPANEHLAVVKECAPRHIDVMVEKPMATTVKDAEEMAALARRYGIKVLTNYETTWYAANAYVKQNVDAGKYGKIYKMEVYDGHQGPFEINCSKRFTDWLTDPVMNGAGALFDFGCYGADIATWLFNGKKPVSVSAVLKTNKPEKYPKVDDDATVVVEYDDAIVEINASWCWPFNRKDMRIYGLNGSVYQMNNKKLMEQGGNEKSEFEAPALAAPYNDSFRWLKAVERGEIQLEPYDRQGLETNVMVVKILDAARTSARTGKAVKIK